MFPSPTPYHRITKIHLWQFFLPSTLCTAIRKKFANNDKRQKTQFEKQNKKRKNTASIRTIELSDLKQL